MESASQSSLIPLLPVGTLATVNEESMAGAPLIYVVIPCYNEEEVLPITARVLEHKIRALIKAHKISQESRVLFVDDGSGDATWSLIRSEHERDNVLFGGIKLAHNRGHQFALMAGLMHALGKNCDAAISMDADMQDDIDALDKFIEGFSKGSDIVYGVRSSRQTDTWFKRTTAQMFYSLIAKLGAQTVRNHADYRLMSRVALEALSEYSEVNLFLRGVVPSIGLKTSIVKYERAQRAAGESKYPLRKMIGFAIEGITSFSVKPLQLVTGAGIFSALISLVIFVYVVITIATRDAIPGWSSLMFSVWFIGGLIMISLGILGEYVGKTYLESKRRPRFFIEEEL